MKYLIFENNRIKQFKVLALIFLCISKTLNNVGAESNKKVHLFDEDGLEITEDKGNKGFPFFELKKDSEGKIINNVNKFKMRVSENGVKKTVISYSNNHPLLFTQDNKIIMVIDVNNILKIGTSNEEEKEVVEKIFCKKGEIYDENEKFNKYTLINEDKEIGFKNKQYKFEVLSRIDYHFNLNKIIEKRNKISEIFVNEEGKRLLYEEKEEGIIFYVKYDEKCNDFTIFCEGDIVKTEEENKDKVFILEMILKKEEEEKKEKKVINLEEKEDFNICKCCCEGCCKNKEEI